MPAIVLILSLAVLALVFAKVEIHIEGSHGWAQKLPTWRIESHPLLDLFWGGRAMTGYHAWMFLFILLVFHFPLVVTGRLALQVESRILASIMIFWIFEDFLWFVMNPAFGLRRFSKHHIKWHKRWFAGLPNEYWLFGLLSILLMAWSHR